MKVLPASGAALLAAAMGLAAAAAQEDPPPAGTVIAMAQHFIQDRLMGSRTEHHHIEFDLAWIHSRPRKTLWVVVGGYASSQNRANSFTAAVLLECPDFRTPACWSLEKLSLNGQIVLDRRRI